MNQDHHADTLGFISRIKARPLPVSFILAITCLTLTGMSGCSSLHKVETIPASRVPCELRAASRSSATPFPMTSLGQAKPSAHLIGAGDKLSLYVYGVIPASREDSPVIQRTQPVNQRYYPPNGSVSGATVGLPMTVESDGSLELPIVGQVYVAGMTTPEATRELKRLYREKKVVKEGTERVQVSLVTPRVKRIVVIREDTPSTGVTLAPPGQVDYIHRGSGEVIDLPVYENDVLHALAATGGLPGTDAAREIWVFKRRGLNNPQAISSAELRVHTASYHDLNENPGQVVNIPLTGCPGQPAPFSMNDVILEEGDVVFLPRREEFFYTGGLIGGAKVPLPRDEDIDILEAIALARGSVGGPLGQSGTVLANGSPGHLVNPTKATVIRKTADGRQFSICVDLKKALQDSKERILIQPDDVIMMQFRKHEAIANGLLNWVNLNINAGSAF